MGDVLQDGRELLAFLGPCALRQTVGRCWLQVLYIHVDFRGAHKQELVE